MGNADSEREEAEPSGRRDDFVTVIATDAFGVAGVVVSLVDFFLLQRRPWFELDLVGVVILLLGEALIFSGRRALGPFATTRIRIETGQHVVQSGPYRYIRHPIYLGLILQFYAAPIAWWSAYGAMVMLPLVALLLRRIDLEEAVMESNFGSEYERYIKQTKRLIPFIY